MKHRLRMYLLAGLIGLSCSLAAAQSTRPASTSSPAEPSKFLRFVADDNAGGRLEASVVSYRNADGATVDLIAAVHIADASFFRELDESFAGYDSLLYELVKPRDAAPGATMPATGPTTQLNKRGRSLGWVGILQRFMKEKLDLSFQLEEINYKRPNFVHADLDAETFQQMQEDRGESLLGLMLQQMFHEMGRTSPRAYEPGLGDLLVALQSPDRTRQLKLVLAREFGALDELAGAMEGPDGSVIVTERNKAALKVLARRLSAGDKRIGIFYGAAHLKGMENILTEEMGFKQVGEPRWRTAWDMRRNDER